MTKDLVMGVLKIALIEYSVYFELNIVHTLGNLGMIEDLRNITRNHAKLLVLANSPNASWMNMITVFLDSKSNGYRKNMMVMSMNLQ